MAIQRERQQGEGEEISNMAIERTSEIAGKMASAACGEVLTPQHVVAQYIDTQLEEVRAVLEMLAPRENITGGGHCWCRKNLTNDAESHGKTCQRTRTLYERLRMVPVEESDRPTNNRKQSR